MFILLAASFAPATAAVFERDWKTPGDGLLTYDDVNQREWLDLSVSRLNQFPEPRIDNAIAEIGPGGLFEGFTWAKSDDVRALAQSGGIDTSTTNIGLNLTPTTDVINLLEPTLHIGGVLRAVRLINEEQTSYPNLPPYDGSALLVNLNLNTGGGYAGLFFSLPDDLLRPIANGLMLYRVVLEPSTVLSLCIGIGVLVFGRLTIHFRSR